jgi:pilus assembly protein Flp/PilA
MLQVMTWSKMMTWRVTNALRDRRGISAMEYGILAAAIIGVVATAATQLGSNLSTLFNDVITDLTNAVSHSGS